MSALMIQQEMIVPVGSIRTFGLYGHPYLVSDKSEQGDDGKIWVEIHKLETGEKDYYPLNEILLDPEAE
ncbi:DUF5397 family protein [Moraxella sp. ZY210820]|uniref:DUF5397 family protein n=1 Tax=unclassified Moraxella TaxID=2685852 RepID=UPI0027321FCA|nr:DUF5397 family protein [Moraxella sp. ZY210820]WLF84114.1 DUF5397 domain-containing protein [Moraxella sp. ZY210820]